MNKLLAMDDMGAEIDRLQKENAAIWAAYGRMEKAYAAAQRELSQLRSTLYRLSQGETE